MTFEQLLNKEYIILDGAFGTQLIKKGISPEENTADAPFTHREWVKEIHSAYIEAGSDIIYADTFGANGVKLKESHRTVEESVREALSIAREAAEGTETLVALDVSTTGQLLYPGGEMTFDEAYEVYREVVIFGEKYGADLIALETFTDLREARIALLAAKENTSLPVIVTLSFDENGLTMGGNTPSAAAVTLCSLGAEALGLNCSVGPDKMKETVRELLKFSTVPVIVKPNAGLPNPETGEYSMSPSEFSSYMKEFYTMGVRFFGGCCGTSPEYIRELKNALLNCQRGEKPAVVTDVICGTRDCVILNQPQIIGERINPTGKKKFKEALERGDLEYILGEGISQLDAGAKILDVNVGHSGIDEEKMMDGAVQTLQGTLGAPLQLDSASPCVLERALRVYTGRAIINSVNGEERSLKEILPLAKKYGAYVVGLTLDEGGIPETVEERVEIAGKIINRAEEAGIPRERIIIDCLTMTVSTNQSAAEITLRSMKEVKRQFGVKTALGVSNISFGLPSRETVNTAFLTLALENGLDLPIMNPNSAVMTGAVSGFKVLKGFDEGAEEYISLFSGEERTNTPSPAGEMTLTEAILKGLGAKARLLTDALLKTENPQVVVNDYLIPALDRVGEKFEKGEIFLPQLIRSADAAGECFESVRGLMSENCATEEKGAIVLATVKGDIHDIGKNIVKTVLENYGYKVIDLGKDVSPEEVVRAQKETGAGLVGLSALMTTTLPAMASTVEALKQSGATCRIMVGGAVLTKEYAEKIGADFYARDAKMSADIAGIVFGK